MCLILSNRKEEFSCLLSLFVRDSFKTCEDRIDKLDISQLFFSLRRNKESGEKEAGQKNYNVKMGEMSIRRKIMPKWQFFRMKADRDVVHPFSR